MAKQTVKYNPKTGAKLKKGESVSYGGKTYTEGSSNIYGSSSKTTPTKTTSTGTESVKALQRQLNAKGANLKVDGVMGPLTKAAQDEYGSVPMRNDTNYGAINPKPTYGTTPIPKASIFANPFAKGSGNFFKNVLGGAKMVGGGIKDAISASVSKVGKSNTTPTALASEDEDPFAAISNNPSTYQVDPYGGKSQVNPDIKPKSPFELLSGAFTDTTKETAPTATASTPYSADDAGSLALTPGQFTEQAPTPSNPTGSRSGGTTMSSLEEPIDPVLPPGEIEPVMGETGGTPVGLGMSSAQLAGLNQVSMGLKDNSMANDPFTSTNTKSEFQNNQIVNYADNAAKYFTSPDQATAYYNSPIGQAQAADYVAKGGKIADIIAKIKPIGTVNDIQPAQTMAEYLAGGPQNLQEERNLMNQMIANEANFTQQQKDILFGKKDANGNDILLGIAAQQKKENEERIAYYDKLEARFDKNEKEKARLAIDKARAEFEMKDAEVEIARVNAKNNLTEFLAKIGALRTDGNALLGIEKLEQAYQAQRQQLRQNFLFAEREIRQAAEERMFNLETDLEDKKFKLSQDLSKTEREVMMEGMKLDYDFNKTLNNLKLKWSDSIKTEREKAAAKAEKAAGDWTNAYLTTMGADMFKALPAEFRNTWLSNNPIDQRGYKTTQEDLAATFADWQQKQGTVIPLTDTQYSKAMAYIQTNSDNFDEDVNAFNTDNTFRSQILGKIQ